MFGHMKTRSKKSRTVVVDDENDDADVGGLSVFNTFCPVRRKRSRIRYKTPPHPSFSGLNEYVSAFNEVSDVEIAAATLVMLSKGVRGPIRFNSSMEFSGDGSEYFGAGEIKTGNNVSRFVANSEMKDGFGSYVGLMHCAETDMKYSVQVSGDSLGRVDVFKKHDELNGSKRFRRIETLFRK